jgi:hypothetical protein
MRAVASTASSLFFVNPGPDLSPGDAPSTPTTSTFTGGGLLQPSAVAVDGAGQVWIANGGNSVSSFSNSGAARCIVRTWTVLRVSSRPLALAAAFTSHLTNLSPLTSTEPHSSNHCIQTTYNRQRNNFLDFGPNPHVKPPTHPKTSKTPMNTGEFSSK